MNSSTLPSRTLAASKKMSQSLTLSARARSIPAAARRSLDVRALFTNQTAKAKTKAGTKSGGTKKMPAKKSGSGGGGLDRIIEKATTPAGNEPNWIDTDFGEGYDESAKKVAVVKKKGTMVRKRTSVYIGKEKSPFLGNVGEPRYVEDFDDKYPSKEAYGPFGIFDNASGGWAGGEAGLKLMWLAAETEKLSPGSKVTVRINLDLRTLPFNNLRGEVVKTMPPSVNDCNVILKLEDAEPWWETAVLAFTAVSCGGVLGIDGLAANAFGLDALKFIIPFTAVNAAIIVPFCKNLYRRRTNGEPVGIPIEHIFIPGVDKVPDAFWDGKPPEGSEYDTKK